MLHCPPHLIHTTRTYTHTYTRAHTDALEVRSGHSPGSKCSPWSVVANDVSSAWALLTYLHQCTLMVLGSLPYSHSSQIWSSVVQRHTFKLCSCWPDTCQLARVGVSSLRIFSFQKAGTELFLSGEVRYFSLESQTLSLFNFTFADQKLLCSLRLHSSASSEQSTCSQPVC